MQVQVFLSQPVDNRKKVGEMKPSSSVYLFIFYRFEYALQCLVSTYISVQRRVNRVSIHSYGNYYAMRCAC